MIDHTLYFATEQEARQAIPDYCSLVSSVVNENYTELYQWNPPICIPNQTFTLRQAEYDNTIPYQSTLITPAIIVPGFWITIALPELSANLVNLPNYALRWAKDRTKAPQNTFNNDAFVYKAPDMSIVHLAVGVLSPIYA